MEKKIAEFESKNFVIITILEGTSGYAVEVDDVSRFNSPILHFTSYVEAAILYNTLVRTAGGKAKHEIDERTRGPLSPRKLSYEMRSTKHGDTVLGLCRRDVDVLDNTEYFIVLMSSENGKVKFTELIKTQELKIAERAYFVNMIEYCLSET